MDIGLGAGALLKFYMEKRGITVETLALMTNYSPTTVKNWRAGRISVQTVDHIANVMRLTTAEAHALRSAITSPNAPPRLHVSPDGRVWIGETEVDGWDQLPTLQRNLLEYLYSNRGKLCRKDDILRVVWRGNRFTPSDDSLRKLAERLAQFIEPYPEIPVYIRKVRGGHYRLDNTSEPDADE